MEKSNQLKYVLLGILFWFLGALIVRYTGEFFFTGSSLLKITLFVLLFPLSYVFILIANPKPSETLECVVIMTYSASFLDGLALTFFPTTLRRKYRGLSLWRSCYSVWSRDWFTFRAHFKCG